MSDFLNTIGLVAVATVFGSIVFFSAVVAPLTFVKLDKETARNFIRSIFPWYYLLLGVFSLVAFVVLAFNKLDIAALMGIVLIGACISRQILMPNINKQRDRQLAGDAHAENSFNRLHRYSVLINFSQMIIALYALISFAVW